MTLRTFLIGSILLETSLQAFAQEGPSQQCADDAGPPFADDSETFGGKPYSFRSKAQPIMINDGKECAGPLKEACTKKDPKTAYLEGPIDCGGAGWFCRITVQPGWSQNENLMVDSNFMHCNTTNEPNDRDGHCHGGDKDDVYPWWVRDHWFRNYKGHLTCCCDLQNIPGLVDRCDFRKRINSPQELATCRDANEEHNVELGTGCNEGGNPDFADPAYGADKNEKCWEVSSFGYGQESDYTVVDCNTTTTCSASRQSTLSIYSAVCFVLISFILSF